MLGVRNLGDLENLNERSRKVLDKRLRKATIDIRKSGKDPGITRKYMRISDKPANRLYFRDDNGVEISVAVRP